MNEDRTTFSDSPSPRPSAIRILLADPHPVVRIGVGNLLQTQIGMEVAGEAEDYKSTVDGIKNFCPDVLLLDGSMPDLPGMETLRSVSACSPGLKIILLVDTISNAEIIEALKNGAQGITLKNAQVEQLVPAIRTVAAGAYWIGGKRVTNLVRALEELTNQPEPQTPDERKLYGLTPRELEVVHCVIDGFSNRDIAERFQLSEETVKRHLSNIFDKAGVSTRLELALFALEHHLVVRDH